MHFIVDVKLDVSAFNLEKLSTILGWKESILECHSVTE
jgi:hypothetical protein